MSGKKVLIILADGFEEIEAVTVIDILRRGKVEVVAAGLHKRNISGSHGIRMICDSVLEEEMNSQFDMIILPGGTEGVANLSADPRVAEILNTKSDIPLAAICAAPSILLENRIIGDDTPFTIHPSLKEFTDRQAFRIGTVIKSGRILTGRSAGAAMDFAFQILEDLCGPDSVESVNAGVLYSSPAK